MLAEGIAQQILFSRNYCVRLFLVSRQAADQGEQRGNIVASCGMNVQHSNSLRILPVSLLCETLCSLWLMLLEPLTTEVTEVHR